jgi:hypothetical protein
MSKVSKLDSMTYTYKLYFGVSARLEGVADAKRQRVLWG